MVSSAESAASLSVPPVFGGSDGEPSGSPVPAGAARYANPFELPPSIGVGSGGFCKPLSLEAVMAASSLALTLGNISVRQLDDLFLGMAQFL